MSIPDTIKTDFLFTTVRIEVVNEDNSSTAGTGFLFEYYHNDDSYIFLVTNKHVIKNSRRGILQFNLSSEDTPVLGNFYTFTFVDFENEWFLHPEKNVDIAIMPFGPILHEIEKRKIDFFSELLSQNLYLLREISK
ncbi:hypothetical protein ES705_38371 [subsurface metagenome]